MKPFDWEQSAYLGYMVEQYENAQIAGKIF